MIVMTLLWTNKDMLQRSQMQVGELNPETE
jgi:hypothetical protein